jgi:hypothetical protein
MSTRINNNKEIVAKKSYCKVCHDAGKPESEYTSHYVRSTPDRTGKSVITCPTLLSTECRYCHKTGHTTKFCPVIAESKKTEEKAARQVKYQQEAVKKEKKEKKVTGFTAIYIDSDSEDEMPAKVSTKVINETTTNIDIEFPALCATKVNRPVKTGYAAAIATKQAAKVEEVVEEKIWKTKLPEISIKTPPPMKKEFHVKKSWADWSDSDTGDEDEEEDEMYYEEFPSFLEQKAQFYDDYN